MGMNHIQIRRKYSIKCVVLTATELPGEKVSSEFKKCGL